LETDGALAPVTISGMRAVRVAGRDRSTRPPYRLTAHWIAHNGLVFQVVGAAPEGTYDRFRTQLEAVAPSFRRLEAANRSRVVEARLRVVESRRGETLAALLERQPGAWKLPAAAAANALPEDARFDAARPVKNAMWERYPRD
jgi:predicted Zn-dependent protease